MGVTSSLTIAGRQLRNTLPVTTVIERDSNGNAFSVIKSLSVSSIDTLIVSVVEVFCCPLVAVTQFVEEAHHRVITVCTQNCTVTVLSDRDSSDHNERHP